MTLASIHVELDHDCELCGVVSSAVVIGRGAGDDRGGDGKFLAETSAQRDAAALIRLAKCPRCARRNPSAVRALWKRAGWVFAGCVAFGAFIFAIGDWPLDLAFFRTLLWGPFGVGALIAAGAVAGFTVRDLRGSRDRVSFLDPAPTLAKR